MTDFAIWLRGLRGPHLQVLHGSNAIGEHERAAKLCEPKPIAAEHEGLPIVDLARLYPFLNERDAAQHEKLLALARDPGATDPERAVATRKVEELRKRHYGDTK